MSIQAPTHIFVQGISSALVRKWLTRQSSIVTFCINNYISITVFGKVASDSWKETIINLAGPMSNIAFSTCKLVAAAALKNYAPTPVPIILGSSAVLWISCELFRAYESFSRIDNEGYFCKIARQGNTHLLLASAALITQCTLGLFLVIKTL